MGGLDEDKVRKRDAAKMFLERSDEREERE
jgi:hypothetical protein